MNIYIMVDAEGISGIYESDQVISSGSRYEEGRRLMVKDINACVEGLKEAGVDKIYVRDAHSSGSNVIWEELSDLADYYIIGYTGDNRFPGLEDCDAVILLGYHAMAGTPAGILEHTMSSASVQNYYINGDKVGEIAIDAAIVGEKGKPVIMVSGDDKACAEAKELLPNIVTAEVKKGLSWKGGMLLPPKKSYDLIRDKAKEAVNKMDLQKPFSYDKPIRFQVELTERGILPHSLSKPYMRIIDGRRYEVEAESLEEALFRL